MLDASRQESLGECYFHLREFERAKEHYWFSLNYISNKATVSDTEDTIERCNWYAEHFQSYLSNNR